MNILVVGSGGREHALVKALGVTGGAARDGRIFIWPGNAGIRLMAESVPVEATASAKDNYTKLAEWTKEAKIELAVIGPEADLVAGLSDLLRKVGLRVFGPSKDAAQLEGSKIFAKNFMQEFNVPTARAQAVATVEQTLRAAQQFSPPYVLKADGLAAGKGVFICADLKELESSAHDLFVEKKLGEAGSRALLEEFQPGKELSVLVLTNGTDYQILPFARDHKKLCDGDSGPNTGGMGVVAPISIDAALIKKIEKSIIQPTLVGIQKSNFLYRGIIFIGVMLTPEGPRVLEYNVRFGDPETQALLPLLKHGESENNRDWFAVLKAVSEGVIPKLYWSNETVACIVLAAEGYPDNPVKAIEIELPREYTGNPLSASERNENYILHAGTARMGEKFITNGGRVLNVIAKGSTLSAALSSAYKLVDRIRWPGMQYRKDIGKN